MVREERLDLDEVEPSIRKAQIMGNINQRFDALKRYYENPVRCKNCKEIIEVGEDDEVNEIRERKFCSHSCSAKYHDFGQISPEHKTFTEKKQEKAKALRRDGKKLKTIKSTLNLDINVSTLGSYLRREGVIIEHPNKKPVEDMGDKKKIKKKLIDIRGRKCEKCERKEWQDEPIPLNIHRKIDKTYKECRKQDLDLLCKNCHGLEHEQNTI